MLRLKLKRLRIKSEDHFIYITFKLLEKWKKPISSVRDFLCLALVGPTCPSGPGTPDFNMILVLFEGTYDNERIYTCECLYEFDLLI